MQFASLYGVDTPAVDKKIDDINKKIDEHKKPITYVVIGGIILALITFLILLYLLFRLIAGLGIGMYAAANQAWEDSELSAAQNDDDENGNGAATSTIKRPKANRVYAKRGHIKYGGPARASAGRGYINR
jgi:hypothetical protein